MQKITEFLREFKWILLGVLGIFTLIMLWNGCGNKGEKVNVELNLIKDSLLAAKTEIANLQVIGNKLSASIEQLKLDTITSGEKLRKADQLLNSIQKRYLVKRADIKTSSYIPDTTKYLALLNLSDSMLEASEEYQKWAIESLIQRDSLLSIKDSSIELLKQQLSSCQKAIGYVETSIPEISKKSKVRNQIYVGVMAFGNQKAYIRGWGPSASLVTKTGQIFEGGIIFMDSQKFYSVGTKFRLSLKN